MLIGLPGDGKTLYSMQMIIRELVFSERKIVTNIEEIELGRLGEYIEQKYPDARIDLDQRLKIIPKALTQDFFRHRAGDLVLPEVPQNGRDGKRFLREDFLKLMVDYFLPVAQTPETMTPVTYFLDEATSISGVRVG
jgi:RNase P/RNase MRP subunit p29